MEIRNIHLALDQIVKQSKDDEEGSIQLSVLQVEDTQQMTFPSFPSAPFSH